MQTAPLSNTTITPPADVGAPQWRIRLSITAIAAMVYFLTPVMVGEPVISGGHFREFAEAMLHGHVSIKYDGEDFARVSELIPTLGGDRLYLAYPPFPSVLMIPFVALFGAGITSQLLCRLISVLNVAIFDACLLRLPALLRRSPFSTTQRIALDMMMAFGTVTWHNAHFGGDWHYAHAITLCAALVALCEFAGPRRPTCIGICTAIIVLTRPTAVLVCLFFLLPWIRKANPRALLVAATLPVAAVVILGYYNYQRFANPFDFGYSQMFLTGSGARLMETYGQFNARYVCRNAFWFFLAPPWITLGRFPLLAFDPNGLGLFFATPALLYVFVSIIRHHGEEMLQDALIAILLCLVPLLAYFNTGFMQFGHRFSMDYLAILMFLTIWGMGPRLSRIAYAVIALSITLQVWGVFLHNMVLLPQGIAPGV
jgi:hypothetical protein